MTPQREGVTELSQEDRAKRQKLMEMLRWTALGSDIVAATVFVLFAESIGDIAYPIAAILAVTGIAYFVLWRRIFKSTYAAE